MGRGACTVLAAAMAVAGILVIGPPGSRADETLSGFAAYGDWSQDRPALRRKITMEDMPAPMTTPAASKFPSVVKRPDGASPKVPPGFTAELLAFGLDGPRVVRTAPNGDLFVAESDGNQIRTIRLADGGGQPSEMRVFASKLNYPFGVAFYPPGPDPRYVYVATTSKIVRFPYRTGDMEASGPAEIIVSSLPRGGHATRDLAFSPDGKTMFVSIGSQSNDAERLPRLSASELETFEREHGVGAAWGDETDRAVVLAFDPDGRQKRGYATGLRNCASLTIQPPTDELWCAVNERDQLGDDLPPDFITRVKDGAFYGWPWYYIGGHVDPRHKGERPELMGGVAVPDVLIQPHSAPLGLAFYDGEQFPSEYKGSVFVALHGSWNRAKRTGYKVIRLIFRDGKPTGEYEDFMVGFVLDEARVWARPVGVAVAHDGSLLVTEDGNGTIWRVAYSNHGGTTAGPRTQSR